MEQLKKLEGYDKKRQYDANSDNVTGVEPEIEVHDIHGIDLENGENMDEGTASMK